MFRLVAATVACALALTSSVSVIEHVHQHADHQVDHDHGPALHVHPVGRHHVSEGSLAPHEPEIEGCGAADDVVSVVFVAQSPDPEELTPTLMARAMAPRASPTAWLGVAPSDLRAHSPPRCFDGPLRAPPQSRLA